MTKDESLGTGVTEKPSNPLLRDVLEGIVTGGPLGEFLNDERLTGVKTLPPDKPSGKTVTLIHEKCLPDDERYPGPEPWSKLQMIDFRADWWDLNRRIAQGQDPDPGLCRRCRRMCLVRDGTFTDNQLVRLRPFGSWLQLLLRTRCRICRLVVVSLSCGTFQIHPFLREIDPEAQYTQIYPQTLQSGENVLSIEYGLRKFGVIRIITDDNFREVLRQAHETDVQSPFALLSDDKSIFHKKDGQAASTELMKKWITNCEHNHGSNCCDIWQTSQNSDERPIILIDVLDQCLVQKKMSEVRYFTLSYVRGTSYIPSTTKANFDERKAKLSLPQNLPATIQDALTVVTRLNERYLWVDSLCIIQDDLSSKHSDIGRMDAIYSHAVATLVALDGSHADAGLPGVRPGTRPPQRIECPQLRERIAGHYPWLIKRIDDIAKTDKAQHEIRLCSRSIATRLADVTDMMDFTSTRDRNADLLPPEANPIHVDSGMVAHPPSLKHILTLSPWNTRGWTLQERLLSRRCLYFSFEYLYFQCGQETLSETGGNIMTWADVELCDGNATAVEKARETNTLLHFRQPPPSQTVVYDSAKGETIAVKQDFDCYAELIEMYSRRELSFHTDAINAVTGMLKVVHGRIGGEMLSGVPTRYLDLVMMWTPAEPLDRVTPIGAGGHDFPTWSWTAWTARKQFRLSENGGSYNNLEREYATSEVDCFTVFHRGKLLRISKTPEEMAATEIRNLGTPPDRTHEAEFPRYVPYSNNTMSGVAGPDFGPNVLQFWAYTIPITAFNFADIQGTLVSEPEHGNQRGWQYVNSLLDPRRKHCGLIFKPQAKTGYRTSFNSSSMEYILISSFPDSSRRRRGIETIDDSVKPFDPYAFPWRGKGSGLVNVMMIEWFGDVAERLMVAQINRQAWENAKPVKKHIRLV